jgi:predicted alpha/beta-hydrolase family hydrolase
LTAAGERTTGRLYRAERASGVTVVLAHGAGAGQDHPFMVRFATGLSARGLTVVTFDFLYRAAGRRAPDRGPVLERTFADVIAEVRARADVGKGRLILGGKSMGGRIASQLAAKSSEGIDRLFFLGYPLHPPGRPAKLRVEHLARVGRPMLFVQGTRDKLGTPEELRPHLVPLSPRPEIYIVEEGDHSFKVPRRVAVEEQVYEAALSAIAAFVLG